MFIAKQSQESKENYYKLLKIVGSLSNLFTDSAVPYLYYRASENIFCKAFDADNLSRSDCSADASKLVETNNIGIGIKTFLENNGKTFQKVAEFNKNRELYKNLSSEPKELVKKISVLRNKRIESTKVIHGIDNIIYHCIIRSNSIFKIHEQPMDLVQIDKIKGISAKSNSVYFHDEKNEYNFNISKSTLFKRFNSTDNDIKLDIKVFTDPYQILENLFKETENYFITVKDDENFVILPLYSKKREKIYVPERSGLNQWNAGGRDRNENELYIPIPAWIHKKNPDFFPPKDKPFNLHLPNKKIISAKVCQDGNKALMSNPNYELGKWILRDVLNIEIGQLVTYEMVQEIGIDSVQVIKIDEENFLIDFKDIGSYEDFKQLFNI